MDDGGPPVTLSSACLRCLSLSCCRCPELPEDLRRKLWAENVARCLGLIRADPERPPDPDRPD